MPRSVRVRSSGASRPERTVTAQNSRTYAVPALVGHAPDLEAVEVVAVVLQRRVLEPVLAVVQQLRRPVGARTVGTEAVDGPDPDDLRVAHDVLDSGDGSCGHCGGCHGALLWDDGA